SSSEQRAIMPKFAWRVFCVSVLGVVGILYFGRHAAGSLPAWFGAALVRAHGSLNDQGNIDRQQIEGEESEAEMCWPSEPEGCCSEGLTDTEEEWPGCCREDCEGSDQTAKPSCCPCGHCQGNGRDLSGQAAPCQEDPAYHHQY